MNLVIIFTVQGILNEKKMFYRLVNIAILQNFQFHRKCLQNLNEP